MTEERERNPLLRRQSKGHNHGQRSEKRIARRKLKGRQRPGSGSLVGAKGDISLTVKETPTGATVRKWLVECKATVNDSLGVKKAWLDKIGREALELGSAPALTISFTHGNGEEKPNGDWVAIPMWVFKELTS
jgi:hypothetical protein